MKWRLRMNPGGIDWLLENNQRKSWSLRWHYPLHALHIWSYSISRPSMPTVKNSLVLVTHSLFCQEEIRFYRKFLKAARFSLSLSRQFLCQQSWHVQHGSSHYRGGAYLQHLPSLAIHLITVRDLSREESMCYILDMIEYRLKSTHTASPLRQVKARRTGRKEVSEGEKGRKKGTHPVVDFDRCLAAFRCVFDGASFITGRGSVFQD